MKPTCENCRFWKQGTGFIDSCHRYPPSMIVYSAEGHKEKTWPEVLREDFCGEHQPKAADAAEPILPLAEILEDAKMMEDGILASWLTSRVVTHVRTMVTALEGKK